MVVMIEKRAREQEILHVQTGGILHKRSYVQTLTCKITGGGLARTATCKIGLLQIIKRAAAAGRRRRCSCRQQPGRERAAGGKQLQSATSTGIHIDLDGPCWLRAKAGPMCPSGRGEWVEWGRG